MIPFVDLKAQYQDIRSEIDAAIQDALESTQFVLGEEVSAFEQEFARYCGTRWAVALNSGTSALHLALLAAGVGPGDEVITVPMTFVATAAAIVYAGARPVFVDVDRRTYTMDASRIEDVVTDRTKVILPVHLYGLAADMDPIVAIARERGLVVIEDAAQAHGAEYKDRRAGAIGDLGCFSFYPSKNLGAYGEGGAVVANDERHADTVRMLRDWGQRGKHNHLALGFNYRMDGLQGAILRVKLRHLERWTEARRARARAYNESLSGLEVGLPYEPGDRRAVFHVYAVMLERRDEVRTVLEGAGIATSLHYPAPIHLMPAFRHLGYGPGDFPVAESIARTELSLPMYPELTDAQIEEVADRLRAAATTPRGVSKLGAR